MAKVRQVQHRSERETARGKELTAARQEVKQLKRLTSRLQKTIRRLEDEKGVAVEIAEASPEPVAEPRTEADDCSKCGGNNWASLTTPGGKVLRVCRNCKTRVSL